MRLLLHVRTLWILRTTPELRGGSDGEVQEGISRLAGSASAECAARFSRSAVHRTRSDTVRGRWPFGHGAVWQVEGRIAAANPSFGAWRPQPRHLWPRIGGARSA